jgi:hypothetical protein
MMEYNDGYVPPNYRPMATKSRKYARWFLLDRQELHPVALRCSDVGNEAFDLLLQSRKIIVVPPGAEMVVSDMEEMSRLDAGKIGSIMTLLWDICDPGLPEFHTHDASEECLKRLGQEYADRLEAPATTRGNLSLMLQKSNNKRKSTVRRASVALSQRYWTALRLKWLWADTRMVSAAPNRG